MTTAFDNLIKGLNLTPEVTTLAGTPMPAPTATPIVPVPLSLPLKDFQEDAVQHALRDGVNHPYAYIGLDMGLGKTPCGIAVAAALIKALGTTILIVVPPTLRTQWVRELYKFAPFLTTATIRSSKPQPGDYIPNVDVLVIGDSGLAGWADFLTGKIGGLIVDEAHRFKNKSQRADALRQLATGEKKVKDPVTKRNTVVVLTHDLPHMRLLMSGTPTPNGRNEELATQIEVMGTKAWKDIGGKGIFWNHYAPKVDAYGTRVSVDADSLYKAMSSTWYFRRLRDDVMDLPNKGRTPLHLDGSGLAVRDYKLAEADLVAFLKEKSGGKDMTAGQRHAQAIIKLNTLRKLAGECKIRSVIDHAKEVLESQPGGIFIVAEHAKVMDALELGLAKYMPSTVRGGMTDKQKSEHVDAFCDGKSRVLIGQITAAGVGLTLHGGGINHHVIIAQLPWTPADLKQAEDRLHRIGQTKDVLVEVALCAIDGSWTIDERLWGMLEAKNFNSTTITDGLGEYLLSEVQDGILETYR